MTKRSIIERYYSTIPLNVIFLAISLSFWNRIPVDNWLKIVFIALALLFANLWSFLSHYANKITIGKAKPETIQDDDIKDEKSLRNLKIKLIVLDVVIALLLYFALHIILPK